MIEKEGAENNEEKPDAVMRCGDCVYSEKIRMQNTIETQRVCRRFPPTVVGVPVPTDQGGAWSLSSVFPTVADDSYCYEFEARDAPEIEPTGLLG